MGRDIDAAMTLTVSSGSAGSFAVHSASAVTPYPPGLGRTHSNTGSHSDRTHLRPTMARGSTPRSARRSATAIPTARGNRNGWQTPRELESSLHRSTPHLAAVLPPVRRVDLPPPPMQVSSDWATTWPSMDAEQAQPLQPTTTRRRYLFTHRAFDDERAGLVREGNARGEGAVRALPKHYDVVLERGAPPLEFVGDHLQCRYIDFLEEKDPAGALMHGNKPSDDPAADAATEAALRCEIGLLSQTSNFIGILGTELTKSGASASTPLDVEAAAKWISWVRPRSRFDAAPMLSLAKSALERLLDSRVPKVIGRMSARVAKVRLGIPCRAPLDCSAC